MSEVKRFRADHRHVVETEFDDAQFVSVADYDALQQRLTVAEQRLSQVEGACDLAMSAIVDDERGANFVKIIQAIKVKAALNPAEATAPIDDQWEK